MCGCITAHTSAFQVSICVLTTTDVLNCLPARAIADGVREPRAPAHPEPAYQQRGDPEQQAHRDLPAVYLRPGPDHRQGYPQRHGASAALAEAHASAATCCLCHWLKLVHASDHALHFNLLQPASGTHAVIRKRTLATFASAVTCLASPSP